MFNFFLLIDQFGETLQLLINGKERYKTVFGGIMTLCILIISLITFCFFLKEIFSKESPSVNLSTEADEHPKPIYYFDNYEVMISLQDSDNNPFINERIYYPQGVIYSTIVNSNGTFSNKIEVKMEKCSIAMNNSKNRELVQHFDLDNYYCFSRNQTIDHSEFYIKDFWGNNDFRMLQIKLTECTDITKCENEEIRNQYLTLTELSFVVIDNFVQTNDYNNPFKRGLLERYSYVSSSFRFTLTEYLRHAEVISDDGYMFTTNNVNDTFKVDSFIEHSIYQKPPADFVLFTLQFNNIKELYYRKYYKFQDLAAQTGGIYGTLLMIGSMIVMFFSEHSFFLHLINNFYEIKIKETDIKRLTKINPKKNENYLSSKRRINNIINTKKDENEDGKNSKSTISLDKKRKKNKTLIKLSFFDKLIFISLLPKCARTKRNNNCVLYEKGVKTIMNYLDIEQILKRFHHHDLISTLIFSEDKRKLIEFAFKPILSINYIGTRYNLQTLPKKIKDEITKIENCTLKKIVNEFQDNLGNSHRLSLKKNITLNTYEITYNEQTIQKM